ncbi:MAG: hypothetical protein JSV74_02930 [Dehalococcoidia bacterium]|nr:MAG: hypothetical protein JSV74_02930 [Dehalococcoidia bacterium]
MSENRKRILDMLEAGKINTEEAMKLLAALDDVKKESVTSKPSTFKKYKFLRVMVNNPHKVGSDKPEKVNIRVPVALIRAGMKFTSLIPDDAACHVEGALREKGINLNLKNIKDEDIDELIDALREVEVDMDGGQGKVRIYAE